MGWLGGWLVPWAQTPGFGGAMAVLASVIAFAAARHLARIQRAALRKEQWWKRAEWALNLTLDPDVDRREIGLSTLEALSTSEWRAEHEADVIAGATVIQTRTTIPLMIDSHLEQGASSEGESHEQHGAASTTLGTRPRHGRLEG